jgi:hypothetical protein
VRFAAVHEFAAPIGQVMGAMVDPAVYLALELPDVGQPEVLDRGAEAGIEHLRLRYVYTGQLNALARRVVGDHQLAWVQLTTIDRAARAGRLAYASEDPSRRLRGEATVAFTSAAGATTRRIDGELTLALRVARATAERNLVAGVLRRFDLEAVAIERSITQ